LKQAIETQRSFVNAWECDENNHLNIQFYWKRFDDAAQIFQQLNDEQSQAWTDRHVRYHAELRMGSNIIVRSQGLTGRPTVVHFLDNGDIGSLSATAIDQYSDAKLADLALGNDTPMEAAPRSLPSQALRPQNTGLILTRETGLISHRSVISAQECNSNGLLLDQHHIARFSDAASHFWQHLGVSRDWMNQNNKGSVAVEMKASRHNPAKTGMMIQVTTWLQQVREKTLTFRHQVDEMGSGKPLYSGAVTALLMDLKLRKAVVLPDVIRHHASSS
jgi:acyl-CoA thioester hydrolase